MGSGVVSNKGFVPCEAGVKSIRGCEFEMEDAAAIRAMLRFEEWRMRGDMSRTSPGWHSQV